MEDLDILARDFGFGSEGISKPRSVEFRDVFGEPAKFTPNSNYSANTQHSSMRSFDYDTVFNAETKSFNSSSSKTSLAPVYDKPVYDDDDDIFEGLPGLKSKLAGNSSIPSSKGGNQSNGFDDLLGNLGRSEKATENITSRSGKSSSGLEGFDDLLAGFGNDVSAARNRPITESDLSSAPIGGSNHGGVLHESVEASSVGGLDPLNSFGKPAHLFSRGRDRGGKEGSPSRSASPQLSTVREHKGNSSSRYSERNMEKTLSSTNFRTSFNQTTPPHYFEASSRVDMSSTSSGLEHQSDNIWLTVSEIPLSTQPTAASPPSRPAPPIPNQNGRAESVFSSSSSKKKGNKFLSPSNLSQHSESPMFSHHFTKESEHSNEDNDAFSAAVAAAESAAAMKEAMEKAQAKFRYAKEVREREYAKAANHNEHVQLEKDFPDGDDTDSVFNRERKQKEEEEKEQRRLQRDREIERDKARQAVERANREARERAAAKARETAVAETRLRYERAAVEKANAEARQRAGRVAVQRAQAEAHERAAAAAETKENELREKALAARAEFEAKRQAERAAVERAGAEARERAAEIARVRAEVVATAEKLNQQRNDDDLESFFSMRQERAKSTDSLINQQFQNKGGSESSFSGASSNMKKASSSTTIVDDLSAMFRAAEFQEVEGETEERRRARLVRDQRTLERAAKALFEKNQRDLQAQMEQDERHRIAETIDIEIKRWAAGKEGNLRALLSTLQYVLWPECGWQPVSLIDLINGASVKKAYRKATLCIHPDKVQQKGATLQQKYIAEKVFDLLKEAWNKLNSEELF